MERREKILVIGRSPSMMKAVLDLLAAHHFTATGTLENDDAFTFIKTTPFDAVVIGGGIDAQSRRWIKEEFVKYRPHLKFVEHFGRPDSLPEEINLAFINP